MTSLPGGGGSRRRELSRTWKKVEHKLQDIPLETLAVIRPVWPI